MVALNLGAMSPVSRKIYIAQRNGNTGKHYNHEVGYGETTDHKTGTATRKKYVLCQVC